MYLFLLSFLYAGAYLVLFYGIPLFFGSKLPKIGARALASLAIIFLLYFTVLFFSFSIPDLELANRVLHAVGGGSLVVLIYFLAAKDSASKINKFQFFVSAFCIATVFGVGNEIAEFALNNRFGFVFANSVNDTWLDLVSNTIGASLAGACLAPFIKK